MKNRVVWPGPNRGNINYEGSIITVIQKNSYILMKLEPRITKTLDIKLK